MENINLKAFSAKLLRTGGQLHAPAALPPETESLLNKRQDRGPEPIWTFRNKEKSLAPAGYRTMILLTSSP